MPSETLDFCVGVLVVDMDLDSTDEGELNDDVKVDNTMVTLFSPSTPVNYLLTIAPYIVESGIVCTCLCIVECSLKRSISLLKSRHHNRTMMMKQTLKSWSYGSLS